MEIPKSLAILKEACARHRVSFTLIDTFSGFVAQISRDDRQYLVGAAGIGIYPINRAAPFAIARDKAFTHYVLEKAGFSCPRGEHFFLNPSGNYRRPAGRERADAAHFARKLSDEFALPLVAKPNSGKGARLVQFVSSSPQLEFALDAISEIDDIAIVQSFADQPEFRLFLVDGEIVFCYRKSRKTIEGDGASSIRALSLSAADPLPGPAPENSNYLQYELAARGLTLESVLARGQLLPINFISNISAGGRLTHFVEPDAALRAWAAQLARAVSLRVTGVDVFSTSALENVNDIIVTDVNGSPNLGTLYDAGHRDLVFETWGRVLEKTFSDTWPDGY